jgi:hypothetical protein
MDDYSRFTWVLFLQDKFKTQWTLKRFLKTYQNEFGLRIKKIRSDKRIELKNAQIEKKFLERRESRMSSLLPTHCNKILW